MRGRSTLDSMSRRVFSGALLATLAGCGGDSDSPPTASAPATPTPTPTPSGSGALGVSIAAVARFPTPWALEALPSGDLLVGQRLAAGGAGSILVATPSGAISAPLAGLLTPNRGVLDIALHPSFPTNNRLFFSFVEIDPAAPRVGQPQSAPNEQPAGVAIAGATLVRDAAGYRLADVTVIWRQRPKITVVDVAGNYGGKLAVSPDGRYLFATAGDRQEPTSTLIEPDSTTLGKVIRLNLDGTAAPDNPFTSRAGALPEIWSKGHRNPYGLAFDPAGKLWLHDNGPNGGDEFDLILPGRHYGWPFVSNGDQYDGRPIPDHSPGDGFEAPLVTWTPSIAPSDMIFYSGSVFSSWRGDAIVTALRGQALLRVRTTAGDVAEVQRIAMPTRIRAIAEAPDGALWVLEDAPSGRLLRLTPIPL